MRSYMITKLVFFGVAILSVGLVVFSQQAHNEPDRAGVTVLTIEKPRAKSTTQNNHTLNNDALKKEEPRQEKTNQEKTSQENSGQENSGRAKTGAEKADKETLDKAALAQRIIQTPNAQNQNSPPKEQQIASLAPQNSARQTAPGSGAPAGQALNKAQPPKPAPKATSISAPADIEAALAPLLALDLTAKESQKLLSAFNIRPKPARSTSKKKAKTKKNSKSAQKRTAQKTAKTTAQQTKKNSNKPGDKGQAKAAAPQKAKPKAQANTQPKIPPADGAKPLAKQPQQAAQKPLREILRWRRLTSSNPPLGARAINKYLLRYEDWPYQSRMKRRAEHAILTEQASAKRVLSFFKDNPPLTASGRIALARAYVSTGNKDDARQYLHKAWYGDVFSASVEARALRCCGKLLTKEDHLRRAHFLLYKNGKKYRRDALRLAKRAGPEATKIITSRIAFIRRAGNRLKIFGKLSDEQKLDPALTYERVRILRRMKKLSDAWDLLKQTTHHADTLIAPDIWWKERRIHVREAVHRKKYELAYDIAAHAGPVSVNPYNEAQFLAGWIALRFLKKPKLAEEHFTALSKSADGPRSRSRSHYWLGRAALAQGAKTSAMEHFKTSAKELNTFYALLSRQMVNPKTTRIPIEQPGEITLQDVKRFQNRDAIKALILAHKAKLPKVPVWFLSHLRRHLTAPGEMRLLAELAQKLGYHQQSLRIGKTATVRGHNFIHYGYPTHAMPAFKPLRNLPERAFMFGITRQESEFNTSIISHAGARGLMQVMPITARHVTRDHKIKYNLKKLITDPSYNATIGSAYIADRMDEFSGSYIMTMAGFNAGPGRVRQWVRKFGDPRKSNIDPIDWIEQIPFYETRHYVKKVLANIQIFRARLGNAEKALRITADLGRGRDKPYQPLRIYQAKN